MLQKQGSISLPEGSFPLPSGMYIPLLILEICPTFALITTCFFCLQIRRFSLGFTSSVLGTSEAVVSNSRHLDFYATIN